MLVRDLKAMLSTMPDHLDITFEAETAVRRKGKPVELKKVPCIIETAAMAVHTEYVAIDKPRRVVGRVKLQGRACE